MAYVSSWAGVIIIAIIIGLLILITWMLVNNSGNVCDGNRPCPPGLRCLRGACVLDNFCQGNLDCGSLGICHNGQCKECQTNNQCHIGSVCSGGRCSLISCNDKCCPSGMKCNEDTKICQMKECKKNKDCSSSEICNLGYCVEVGNICSMDLDCQGGTMKCLQNRCQQCDDDSDCQDRQTCSIEVINGKNIGVCN